MKGFEGTLALKLDFGELATKVTGTGGGRAALRLAPSGGRRAGTDKYRELDRRRRQAQIKARHQLGLLDGEV